MTKKQEECLLNKLIAIETSISGLVDGSNGGILYGADAREDTLYHAQVTLGAGVDTTFAIPTDVRGFRITTALSDLIFAVDEDPAASVANPGPQAAYVLGDYGVGNISSDTDREVRLVTGDVLHLKSGAGGVVLVEFFG